MTRKANAESGAEAPDQDESALPSEVASFIDTHRIAHLATADLQARPHVIPLCYARMGNRLYFVVDEKPKQRGSRVLKRLANLGDNPQAAIVIDDYDDDWSKLAYLLLHADSVEVADPGEYDQALVVLRARYPQYRDMLLEIRTHPMVRMTLRRWHLWRARSAKFGTQSPER